MSWAGTRGVISLAAAFAIPTAAAGPYRDLLLICAYAVVLVTLVVQGVTFAPLMRVLGLRGTPEDDLRRADEARLAAVRAGERRLARTLQERTVPDDVLVGLRQLVEMRRQRSFAYDSYTGSAADTPRVVLTELRRSMIDAEREELLHWRDAGRLSTPALLELLRELDHEESLLA